MEMATVIITGGAMRIASAQACLDVLRGAAVLVEQNEEQLTEVLAFQQREESGSQTRQNLRMLKGLVSSFSRVINCFSCVNSMEREIDDAGAKFQPGGGRVPLEVSPHEGATETGLKVPRRDVAATSQHEPQQHPVEPTSGRSMSSTFDVRHLQPPRMATAATATVLTSQELLVHIMGYFGRGNRKLRKRKRGLGEMALVSRAWRDAAQHASLWEPLAKELMARVADRRRAETTQAELARSQGIRWSAA